MSNGQLARLPFNTSSNPAESKVFSTNLCKKNEKEAEDGPFQQNSISSPWTFSTFFIHRYNQTINTYVRCSSKWQFKRAFGKTKSYLDSPVDQSAPTILWPQLRIPHEHNTYPVLKRGCGWPIFKNEILTHRPM